MGSVLRRLLKRCFRVPVEVLVRESFEALDRDPRASLPDTCRAVCERNGASEVHWLLCCHLVSVRLTRGGALPYPLTPRNALASKLAIARGPAAVRDVLEQHAARK